MSDLRSYYRETTEKYIRKAEELYNRPFDMPIIDDSLRGHCGGQAYTHQWKLRFNNDIARRYKDDPNDPYEHTIGHEVAHLIARKIHEGRRIRPHGPEWKRVMIAFGLRPDRCHTYETTAAKRKAGYIYKCKCQEFRIGPKRHKNMQTGTRTYHCRSCKGTLEFVRPDGIATRTVEAPKPPKAPTRPRKVAARKSGPTKLQQAIALMEKNPGWTRGSYIDCFMQVLGMTKAGASTYYYSAKKALGG